MNRRLPLTLRIGALPPINAWLDVADHLSRTPAFRACRERHVECLKILIEHEVNVDTVDSKKWTLASQACENGDMECLKVLVEAGVKLLDVATAPSSEGGGREGGGGEGGGGEGGGGECGGRVDSVEGGAAKRSRSPLDIAREKRYSKVCALVAVATGQQLDINNHEELFEAMGEDILELALPCAWLALDPSTSGWPSRCLLTAGWPLTQRPTDRDRLHRRLSS
jgi:hypothetical protein